MPLDPKQIAGEAIMRGELLPLGACSPFIPVKLPSEVGIGRIETPPPPPKVKHQRKNPQRPRYVIHEKDLRAMGFTRQEIEHLKHEVG